VTLDQKWIPQCRTTACEEMTHDKPAVSGRALASACPETAIVQSCLPCRLEFIPTNQRVGDRLWSNEFDPTVNAGVSGRALASSRLPPAHPPPLHRPPQFARCAGSWHTNRHAPTWRRHRPCQALSPSANRGDTAPWPQTMPHRY